jgi:hypothetical protein
MHQKTALRLISPVLPEIELAATLNSDFEFRGRSCDVRTLEYARTWKEGSKRCGVKEAGTTEMAVRRQMRARWDRWRSVPALVSLLLAGLVAAYAAMPPQEARAQKPSRDDVQAAYLYNFGKFVRWPENAGHGPIQVCVAGEDSFGQTIGRLTAGEQIDGRALQVRSLDRPEAEVGCAILFVGTSEHGREDSFLAAAAGKPILTVGDGPDFLTRGGMIQFFQVEDHVRFSVNLDAANRNGVGLSSELLKVAVSVKGKPQGGGAR